MIDWGYFTMLGLMTTVTGSLAIKALGWLWGVSPRLAIAAASILTLIAVGGTLAYQMFQSMQRQAKKIKELEE
jgi:hypothetical protein